MKPKRIPPRWFSSIVFLLGICPFIYLWLTEDNIRDWIFPTGLVETAIMVLGLRWFMRPPRAI